MTTSTVTEHSPKCADGYHFKYELTDLAREEVICRRCGKKMQYRSTRMRKIKDAAGDISCIADAPRFSCRCGSTRTMHPYFLATRKKYSLVAIQEIVSADAYGDRKGMTVQAGTANIYNSRRWVVRYLWRLLMENQIGWPGSLPKTESIPSGREDIRAFICSFHESYGDDWLLEISRALHKADAVDLSPLRSMD